MDPISAISLASSLITFVDFSWRLVSGAHEIYKSGRGTTSESAQIGDIIEDLQELTSNLETEYVASLKAEKALRRLASGCKELSTELLVILNKLKHPKTTRWKALKITWDSILKKDEIQSIRQRLGEYRSQITLHLNTLFLSEQSAIKIQLDQIQASHEQLRTARFNDFEDSRGALRSALEQSARWPPQQSPQSNNNASDAPLAIEPDANALDQIQESLRNLRDLVWKAGPEKRLLSYLYFDSMYTREESIHDPEQGTLTWLFGDEPTGHIPGRPDFIDPFDGGIFHLSGKAGSGKSTTMKAIFEHPRTKIELQSWAKGKVLILAHFFFWNVGEALQGSLDGLYRSILFEVLKTCPELIPLVFPGQWASLQHQHTQDPNSNREELDFTISMFRPRKIKEGFDTLVNEKLEVNYSFCFFIDGLDEYRGDSVDHWELAGSLLQWSGGSNVKCCVSSRPHNEFLDTFSEGSRIHLHKLNKQDIYTFSCMMFEKDRNFKEVETCYQRLVARIVESSWGVFLWARLVVRILLSAVGRRDPETVLFRQLEALPKDLSLLYTRMLGVLEPVERYRADTMLLLALENSRLDASQHPLTALAFSWLDELENPEFPASGVRIKDQHELDDRYERVKRQLNSLTKGLLEIGPARSASQLKQPWILSQRVQFFHRTVPEYLRSEGQLDFSRLTGGQWKDAYVRLRVAEIGSINAHPLNWLPDLAHLFHYIESVFAIYRENKCQSGLPTTQALRQLCYVLSPKPLAISWYWVYNYRLPGYLPNFDSPLSFIHYAAFHGHDGYVLGEIANGDKIDIGDSMNLVLSSSCGRNPNPELVSSLLSLGFSLTDKCRVYKNNSNIDLVPGELRTIWILFVGQLIDYILKAAQQHQLDDSNTEQLCLDARYRILLAGLKSQMENDMIITFRYTDESDQWAFTSLQEIVLACSVRDQAEIRAAFGDMLQPTDSTEPITAATLPSWARVKAGIPMACWESGKEILFGHEWSPALLVFLLENTL
ncbi:kinase-related protein [Purpureocillium lavendulum]|uniref:Kinase-related protein n=1 Tax=Purpureocillium lavendulum TaxID=1247861 RepID=A0AB34FRI5_9HYPO|nr:kinase-related protein [Purpureocillium lavendulum]